MMGHRGKMKGGDEYDGLSPWKRYHNWAPGVRKLIKRGYNKRMRKVAKARLARKGIDEKGEAVIRGTSRGQAVSVVAQNERD